MKYLQPRFSVSMPGDACDWPFVPRDAHWRFWTKIAAFTAPTSQLREYYYTCLLNR
jgi:hypothetical protein